MICVATRLRLARWWHLVPLYASYRRMRPDLEAAPGLLRHAFLLHDPFTCFTFSVWESERALRSFANTDAHLRGVRLAHRVCREVWSAYTRVDAISRSAQSWPGAAPWPELLPHPLYNHRLVQPTVQTVQREANR